MKKFILPLVVTLLAQTIAPAMAQTSKQFDVNDVLLSGEVINIWDPGNTASDWDEARRICDEHVQAYAFTSGDDTGRVVFDPVFSGECASVEAHFYEAALEKRTEKLNSDLKKLDYLLRKDAEK